MAYSNILDMHTHTDNSFDGNHSVMFMCESAVAKKLRAIAFTDHIEMDVFKEQSYDRVALQSYIDLTKARSTFEGTMIVCVGVELGEATYNLVESEKLLSKMKYDFVIGSIHNLRGIDDFCCLNYESLDIYKLLDEYFDELYILAKWGKFDTLAHMTYPLRYIEGEHNIDVDMSRFDKKIEKILKKIIEKNVALEINTSGFRQPLHDTMPYEAIIQRYHDLGGTMITIGSDSHYAEDIGKGINHGMEMAKRCGFDSVTLFQNRQPVQIPIE